MTEITRVPLQPIAKGSVGKLWLGIAAAAAVAGGLAWSSVPPLVKVQTLTKGEGPSPVMTDVALIHYKGMLKDGKVFDQAKSAPLPLAGVIPGFTKALMQMQKGGKYHIVIPAKLGYGDRQVGEIPPNSDLTFDIELLGFMNFEQFQQQQQMMQQLRAMQSPKQGAGAGGAGAADGAGEMPPGGMPPGEMPEGAPHP
ncbi:MAG: FKBP-type peptidyl-prolyl cis-trans isomerase [Novosphingobium sp.]